MAAAVVHEDTRRQAASPGVDYTLVRLVAGEIDGITFVEVGPDGISSFTLVTDPLGRPRRRPRGVILTWSGLLSGLSAEIDLARFQLAGGIGSADAGPSGPPSTSVGPAALSEGADSVIARALATLLEDARESALGTSPDSARRTPQLDVVLVRRAYDWPVLDVMIKAIWAQARPVTEIYQGLTPASSRTSSTG